MCRLAQSSVVIAAYGNAAHLNQAVQSVLDQTDDDFELIIVDDHSDPRIVADYEIPDRAVFIQHEQRQGCGAAGRNTGALAASGRYVAFLDVDDFWLPHKLTAQVHLLESRPDAGLAYCHYILGDENLNPLTRQDKPRPVSADPLRQMICGNYIHSPSAVMVRKDALLALGGFSTELIANDWDMWIRLAAHSGVVADPQPGIIYRTHPGQMSSNKLRMHDGSIAVMTRTLEWAESERPELANLVRERLCRILRKQSLVQMEYGQHRDAARSLRKAAGVWPRNIRTYGLLARAWAGMLRR